MKVSVNSLLNDFAVMKKVYTVQKMDEMTNVLKGFKEMKENIEHVTQ